MENASKEILANTTMPNELKIVKSNNSIESISTISADYDLLVLGTPEKDNWKNVLFGTGKDKFANKSVCSVLRLTMKD